MCNTHIQKATECVLNLARNITPGRAFGKIRENALQITLETFWKRCEQADNLLKSVFGKVRKLSEIGQGRKTLVSI